MRDGKGSSDKAIYAFPVKLALRIPVWLVLGAVLGAFVTCLVRFSLPGEAEQLMQAVTALIAGLAFVVALSTFKFNWAKSQRDLFTSNHEKLIDPDIQQGRRILARQVLSSDTLRYQPSVAYR